MPTGDRGLSALLDVAFPFALPLHRPFRGVQIREGVLFEGPSGWGEFAPFADYSDSAAARWLDCAIEAAFGRWPDPLRTEVSVNAIIPELGPDDAAALARVAVLEHGCRTVKVKVGSRELRDDEARVASVRDVLDTILGRGKGALRIDANGAWTVAAGRLALRSLAPYDLEYVEQPCRTVSELRELRGLVDTRVAVDESIRTAVDPSAVRVGEYADVAVLKPAPLGGVAAALAVAESIGVPVVISGALDSSVGLGVALAAAAALPDLPYDCGLGTGALLAEDLVRVTVLPVSGTLQVLRTNPDPASLKAACGRVSDERAAWWRGRIESAWAAGAGERSGSLVTDGHVKG